MDLHENTETLNRKAYSLEVINMFASALIEASTVEEVAWAIAKQAIAKLGYDDCVVYIMEPDGKHIKQSAAHGPNKNPNDFNINNPIVLKLGEGICGNVAITKKAEIIGDTSKDKRYHVDDAIRFSEIAVPIIAHDGSVLGVIDSEHPEKNFYSEFDLEILSTVARMASTKIDQARAMEQIRLHRNLLEKKVEESTAELKNTIAKLQESNREIQRRSTEKETLLKEIHHRVKNNLQIVSSLLTLQAAKSESNYNKDVFLDCQNRIKSMAIIHEQLYSKGDMARIATDRYIEEIANSLYRTYISKISVALDLHLDRIHLSIDQSVPFGLILNEILVNCFKHAFGSEGGHIKIHLIHKNDQIELEVCDNGIGFDHSADYDTLGIGLIETLTQQLEGKILYTSTDKGTCVKLNFNAA